MKVMVFKFLNCNGFIMKNEPEELKVEKESKGKKRHSKRRILLKLKNPKLIVAILDVIIAFFLLIVSVQLLDVADKQARIMEQQKNITIIQTEIMKQQRDILSDQTEIMKQQRDILAKQNEIIQLTSLSYFRPYLRCRAEFVGTEAQGLLKYNLFLENYVEVTAYIEKIVFESPRYYIAGEPTTYKSETENCYIEERLLSPDKSRSINCSVTSLSKINYIQIYYDGLVEECQLF